MAAEAEASVEPVKEDDAKPKKAPRKRAPAVRKKKTEDAAPDAAPAAEPTPTPAMAAAEPAAPPAAEVKPDEPPKPKRKGWWSLGG